MSPSATIESRADALVQVNEQEVARLARFDRTSWWIRGRRAVVTSVLAPRRLPRGLVADLGCGAGGMWDAFRDYGPVIGIDISPLAATLCRARGYRGVAIGTMTQLPLRRHSMDLLGATDVLEHLADDAQALVECHRVLRPGGVLILTVPAVPSLYGPHDRALGHFRRYARRDLARLLEQVGFRVERLTYFNTLLLPLVAIARLGSRLTQRTAHADALDLGPGNGLAYRILRAEGWLLRFGDFPLGLSLLCIARKPHDDGRAPDAAGGQA